MRVPRQLKCASASSNRNSLYGVRTLSSREGEKLEATRSHPRRYLFERIGVFAILAAALAIISFVILSLPYDITYLTDSGAPRIYLTAFVVLAAASSCVFILGMFYNSMLWMEGSLALTEKNLPKSKKLLSAVSRFAGAVFSRDFGRQAWIFLVDSLLLRKLWKTNRTRWFFHASILFGMLGIFILDLVTVLLTEVLHLDSFINPDGWGKIWIRDFGFELFGTILLIGLIAAAGRRFVRRPRQLVTGSEDVISLLFLLAVVLSGFVLEGIAIASHLPGHESNWPYSFLGYFFSSFMPIASIETYAQLWFAHAVLSVAFIAYIPFSKLFHIFSAPLAIQLEGIVRKRGGE